MGSVYGDPLSLKMPFDLDECESGKRKKIRENNFFYKFSKILKYLANPISDVKTKAKFVIA